MIRHNILSNTEAAENFFRGIRLLKDSNVSPSPWPEITGPSIYDFFTFWHYRAMMTPTPDGTSPSNRPRGNRNAAHSGPVFLPWHRYMLLMLESYLRDVLNDNDFRIPYWDWPADASLTRPSEPQNRTRPEDSAIWQQSYLGQFTDIAVWPIFLEENPFARGTRVRNQPRALIRDFDFSVQMASKDQVRNVIRNVLIYDAEPYNDNAMSFRDSLESMHNSVHVWIAGNGGDMGESTSPNDPAFYLHHCNVDRIWAAWQARHQTASYLPPQSATDDLMPHRIDDTIHTFFNHGGTQVTPRSMWEYNASYRYDTLNDLLQ